ncbi:hypothetical protein [Nocardia carnea]|uniref:hypothetical protein n=1 Tax=Nocardia carnea TaxID=37328 RepID=UPI002457D64E|nr:hypothetical protein [Nocardia carnea]
MHAARQLSVSMFSSTLNGNNIDPHAVFPEWTAQDRFGIVVDEPLGGLGASLLMQLAIAKFYSVKTERIDRSPTYPEVYLFHVGGRHGDFNNFDIWPPRKELFLPNDPLAVLDSINAHAITRIAVPAGCLGSYDRLRDGASSWAEIASARDRLRSCFQYDPSGVESKADWELTTSDAHTLENIFDTIYPAAGSALFKWRVETGTPVPLPGLSNISDIAKWAAIVDQRLGELPSVHFEKAKQRLEARMSEDVLVESYRQIDIDSLLSRLCHLAMQ